MNYWDANAGVIRDKFPGFLEELRKGGLDSTREFRVLVSAAGYPVLTVNGVYVHSPRDPVREARRLAEAIDGSRPAVILGFGLGYAAEAAAEKAGDQPIVIAEAQRGVLRKALETRDLRSFLSKYDLMFVVGGTGEGIISALQVCENRCPGTKRAPSVIRNPTLTRLDEPWYAKVEQHIQIWVSKNTINRATLRRFGKRWVRNLARNMTAIRDLPGIAHLTGVLRNPSQPIPVFLAAAGPSLDSIAPLFPEISKRCVVVAVDTSLKLIRDAGVDPDFAVVVDPQYWNSRHLDRAFAPRTCLIAESAVYPPVLRHPFQRAFLCASLFPLGEFVENRLDPKGRLGAGGSVAATAWDFARRLGPSALWIGGLDLAFPDLKTHFKGALFENRALAESTRFNPLETWSVRALGDGKPFQAPSASGGFVLTDRRLSLYAAWFESRIQRVPELPNYRLSDEGIAIAGLSRVSEKELLALPVQRNHINQRLQEAFIRIEETFNKQRIPRDARYQEALGELLEGLKQINALAEEGFRIADRAYQQRKQCRNPEEPGHYDQDGIFKTLERIDKEIRESAVKDVAGFLFPPFEALEQERAETEPLLRYLEVSANLYRSLKETAKYNLDVLEKCTKG